MCVNSVRSFMICKLIILWGISEFNNFVKEYLTLNLEFSGIKSAYVLALMWLKGSNIMFYLCVCYMLWIVNRPTP